MTLRKIHKRAKVAVVDVNKRQAVSLPSSAATTTTTNTPVSHGIQQPTGPPLGGSPSTTSTRVTTSTPVTGTSAPVTSPTTGTSVTQVTTTAAVTSPQTQVVAATTAATSRATSNVVSTRSITTHTSATSTRTSATATSTSDDSSGMGLGSIAGAAAAAIVGIGVITAFVIWFIRRRKRNSDIDEEPFNRNSFLRQSTAIPDDEGPLPSRARHPPPNMIERQPTPSYGATNQYNDMGNNGFGYNTQPSYNGQPGQAFNTGFGPGGAPATPLPHSPGYGYDQGFNNNGYAELTRGNTGHDYPPSPHGFDQYNHHLESPHVQSYAGHDNFPLPPTHPAGDNAPGQDAVYNKSTSTYPELSPATASAQQGQVVSVRNSAYDGRETPVQLGFAPANSQNQTQTQTLPQTQTQTQAQTPAQNGKKQRPETMYDDEDAYGGM